MEMAQYFSQLQLPYAEPQAPPPGTTVAAMQRGRQLALRGDQALGIAACALCHGAALQGASHPFIPGLLGLPRDYVAGQIGAWQTGMRKAEAPDCMAHTARKLRAEDVSAVATWLAAQPVTVVPAAMPSQKGKALLIALPMPCGGAP